MDPHGWLFLLLFLLVQGTGSRGDMEDMKEKSDSRSLLPCVCQLQLNASETLCFQLKGPTCPKNISTQGQDPLDGSAGEVNWTMCGLQSSRDGNASLDPTLLLCSENTTTLKTESDGFSRSGTAATAVSSSVGSLALILLLVGLVSMTLKKWRHERLFKIQLRHQSSFLHLHQPSELSCHGDAIYSNVINLAPWKEEDFAIYANAPRFERARRTSPDQVEYASIVFH